MNRESDPLIGKSLGAYQVQGSLGEGGMARVYKAYHPRLRREVAIKVIHSQVADREGFQARFEREAQVIANLQHSNIVSIYDFGEEGSLTYLVMQYVGGGTLRDQIRSVRRLEVQRAVNYTIQMARALHHAHQHGIVHRDVKPQNMLVSSTNLNHLLLSDFGIAKFYQSAEDSMVVSEMPTRTTESDSSLTSVDQIIGTADYMSPEQASSQQVDARTDVYALGIVLYQMLVGDVPFHSTTLRGLLFQHVYSLPPSVSAKNPSVPEILAQIVNKAIAKAPGERFQSAEAMAQALEMANANATNIMGSLAVNRPGEPGYPFGLLATAPNQTTAGQRRQDSNATLPDDAITAAGQSALTAPSGISHPTTDPWLDQRRLSPTNPVSRKRPLPLSYFIGAAALILALVVFGLRSFVFSGSNNSSSNSGHATAFTEDFHDTSNSRQWLVGNLNDGVTASISSNQYLMQTTGSNTDFLYPQAVGSLPANFTLTTTMSEQASDPTSLTYGLALRFSEQNGVVNCYALLINNTGGYLLAEIGHGHTITSPLWQGSYTNKAGPHTLQVIAQGSNYTFTIDGQSIKTGLNSTSLSNADISDGSLALVVTGPGGHFAVSSVQLSLS